MRTRRRDHRLADLSRADSIASSSLNVSFLQTPDKVTWLSAITLALAYCLASVVSASSVYALTVFAAFCVPNALLMGVLVLAPRSRWWFYLVMLLATSWIAQLSFAIESPTWATVYCLINCFVALIGALSFSRGGLRQYRFEDLASAWRLILASAVAVPVASFASMSAVLFALDTPGRGIAALSYASASALAMLVTVPLMLRIKCWLHSPRRALGLRRLLEAGAISIFLMAIGGIVLRPAATAPPAFVMLGIPLPILLWAAVRFRITGVCSSFIALIVIALLGWYWQLGPFTSYSLNGVTLAVLVYLIATAIPLLLLAAAMEERRGFEQARASSDNRLSAIFSRNIIPTLLWHGDLITDANDAFFRLTGYSPLEIGNGSLRFEKLTLEGASCLMLAESPATERELVLRDGKQISAMFSVHSFSTETQSGVAYLLDLSDSRRAKAAHKLAEELHCAVLGSIHDQIVVLDQRGNIIDANDSWQLYTQRLPIAPFSRLQVGEHFLKHCIDTGAQGDYNATRLADTLMDVMSGKQSRATLEYALPAPGGVAWFHVSIEPLRRPHGGAVIIWTDITGRKEADAKARAQHEQLAHMGRVAVLGELSGAFAHELAQPLTSILGNGEAAMHLVERMGSDPGEIRSILRDIVADSVRAAEVIKRLRALLTRGEISRQPLDLNGVIRDVLELARQDLMTRQVLVSTDLDQSLPLVLGDRVQLQQVMLNLVVNACEAMALTDLNRRRIFIATRFDPGTCTVSCSLQDQGRGITRSDSDRIFQPFVTTKPGGLGMGLAICRSIIEAHGGRLWAENTAAGGAVFTFTANMG